MIKIAYGIFNNIVQKEHTVVLIWKIFRCCLFGLTKSRSVKSRQIHNELKN